MNTEIIIDDISRASEIIKNGGLVAVPTETVYGLAGNGLNSETVAEIYEVKGRPEVKPLSLMVPDASAMDSYCRCVPRQARYLAERFWPGPLTIVLKADEIVPKIVRAGGETVGLRCPDHPLTLALLRECGLPLAAPSANPSGEPSPKTAQQVTAYFSGRIEAVIDGGECGLGHESTIIDMSQTPYRILRQGALPEDEIDASLIDGMTIFGISGGTGCGKTTALEILEDMGALVIDCDAVYHRLLDENDSMLSEIANAFSSAMSDGRLDRKKLGAIVFADPEKLEVLNAITHRYVDAEVTRLLRDYARAGGELAAIDAIALIESGLSKKCDAVVGVTAEYEKRIARLIAREGITDEYAAARIAAQKPDKYFEQNCDYIIENNSTLEDFKKTCTALFEKILGGKEHGGKHI